MAQSTAGLGSNVNEPIDLTHNDIEDDELWLLAADRETVYLYFLQKYNGNKALAQEKTRKLQQDNIDGTAQQLF